MSKEIMSEKALSNKREDRKNMKKFVLILVVSFLIGGVSGFVIAFAEDYNLIQTLPEAINAFLVPFSLYAPIGLSIISTIITWFFYKKAKNAFVSWDGEDEAVYERMDAWLSIGLSIATVTQILMCVFTVIGYDMVQATTGLSAVLIWLAGLVMTMVYVSVAQLKIVNLTKEMNPEKIGSVLDTKFQKKWIGSCDEAEKSKIYESAFTSYKATNYACYVIWIFCFLGGILWDTGVLPIILVGAFWLTSNVSYMMKAYQLEHHFKTDKDQNETA